MSSCYKVHTVIVALLSECNSFPIFFPGRCSFDEQGAKCSIIDILEEFICGDNPQTLFDKLKIEGNVSSVCGHVFKLGEPTYCCRECGVDATCVLCVNCFKQSAHKNHKYKMSTSGGGGCCDCGDKEAWRRDPFCQTHTVCVIFRLHPFQRANEL